MVISLREFDVEILQLCIPTTHIIAARAVSKEFKQKIEQMPCIIMNISALGTQEISESFLKRFKTQGFVFRSNYMWRQDSPWFISFWNVFPEFIRIEELALTVEGIQLSVLLSLLKTVSLVGRVKKLSLYVIGVFEDILECKEYLESLSSSVSLYLKIRIDTSWHNFIVSRPFVDLLRDSLRLLANSDLHLTELDLELHGHAVLGREKCRLVAEALPALTCLEALNLGGHQLGADGCAVWQALRLLPRISTLNLRGNALGFEGGAAVAGAFPFLAGRLRALLLASNGLGLRGGKAVLQALPAPRLLRRLDLADNDLEAEGGTALAPALPSLAALQRLSLRRNGLGPKGARAIAPGLRSLAALEELDLGRNDLGPDGVRAVAQALTALTALRSLQLEANDAGARGGAALSAALAALTELRSLCRGGGGDGLRRAGRAMRVG